MKTQRDSLIFLALLTSAVAFTAQSTSFAQQRGRPAAATLPLQSGRYVDASAAAWRAGSCDSAPMADRTVISKGLPLHSPQFGQCRYRISSVARNVYSVRASCSEDNPTPARYTIISRTEFIVANEYGQTRYRLCTGL